MPLRFPNATAENYDFQLSLGQLLKTAVDSRSAEIIVGSDGRRHDYREFEKRVGRLAASLTALGVEEGDVVAFMDWDSHRYLEAYFAVPMIGAVLQMINVRLSYHQIAYTLASTAAKNTVFSHRLHASCRTAIH